MTAFVLLAHQGGWDEALVVALPIAAFGAILWAANRRAARELDDKDTPPPTD